MTKVAMDALVRRRQISSQSQSATYFGYSPEEILEGIELNKPAL